MLRNKHGQSRRAATRPRNRQTSRVSKGVLKRHRRQGRHTAARNRGSSCETGEAGTDQEEVEARAESVDRDAHSRLLEQPADLDVQSDAVRRRSLPLWERLQPWEHQLVHVTDDGREGHFLVPAGRDGRRYHKSPRDFVFVGFRFVQCQNEKVLVGWCGAERDCCEPPSHRELFPGQDLRDVPADRLRRRKGACPCASRLLAYLGGEEEALNMLAMQRGVCKERDSRDGLRIGDLCLCSKNYVLVNPGEPSFNHFSQWGVVKRLGEKFSCQICHGRPRHCAHTTAVMAWHQGSYNSSLAMPRKNFDKRIEETVDKETGKLKIPSISLAELPFFPENDETVWDNLQGSCIVCRSTQNAAEMCNAVSIVHLCLGISH